MTFDPNRRFCALPEHALAGVNTGCRWPQTGVTLAASMGILDPVTVRRVAERICSLWSGVCGIQLSVVDTPNGANIYCQSGRIDGPNGVLGQSYLPCGSAPTDQLAQLLDDGERWTEDFLERVWLHELGHAIGLDHAPQGSGAVMEPYLTRLIEPQAWDVQQAQARYGAPKPKTPPPSPTPAPTPDDSGYLIGHAAPWVFKSPKAIVVINFVAEDGTRFQERFTAHPPKPGVYASTVYAAGRS